MANQALPSQEVVRQLLDYDADTGRMFWRPRGIEWFSPCGRLTAENKMNAWNARNAGREAFTAHDGKGYLQGQILKYHTFAHRIAFAWMHGEWPDCIDHIDGCGINNKASNLRKVSRRDNARNSAIPITNTAGALGIRERKSSGHWEAHIGSGASYRYLGTHNCKTSAILARKLAEKRMGYHPNHGAR